MVRAWKSAQQLAPRVGAEGKVRRCGADTCVCPWQFNDLVHLHHFNQLLTKCDPG